MSQESSPKYSSSRSSGWRSSRGLAIASVVFLAVVFSILLVPSARRSVIAAGRTSLERGTHGASTPNSPALKSSQPASATSSVTQQQPTTKGDAATTASVPQSQPTPTDPDSQASKLWTEFESSVWSTSIEDWKKLHPDTSCEPFHGRAWGMIADREWSQRCSAGLGPEAAHWSFYVFSLQEPLIPRLEQFDGMTTEFPEDTLAALQSSWQARLTARYGPGEDRSPKMGRAVSFPQYLCWNTPELEIQLIFLSMDPRSKQGRLQLQARHRALLDALKNDQRLQQLGNENSLYEAGSAVSQQVAETLRSDFPDVATMLLKSQPDPDPQQVREAMERVQNQLRAQAAQQAGMHAAGQTAPRVAIFSVPQRQWTAEEFHDALVRLLTSAKTSAPDRRPSLLMAADQLAGRLPVVIENDKARDWDWSEWRTELAGLGVTYSPGVESPWTYGGDLLKRVWADFGDTAWGERAFLALLRQGLDPTEGCKAGSDEFRPVIQQGLAFLDKHPNSSSRLDVQLAVGQAYDTWWSLSQAPVPGSNASETYQEAGEPDADPQEYQQGAEAARQQAIAHYMQLLQADPQSDYALYAIRQLPRLKMGTDTGQRRFYCVVGD